MTREQILEAVTIESVLAQHGVEIAHRGQKELTCKCPFHDDKSPSMTINPDKRVWKCHACDIGGSVVDLVMRFDSCDAKTALEKLGGPSERKPQTPAARPQIVATYDYKDAVGKLLFQVVRLHPKDFRQRRQVDGKWAWDMDGVTRVLFRLPDLAQEAEVWITEGEKDALTLSRLGYPATCNSGGAGKWMDAYTDALKGKDIVICPDNDTAGRKHADMVRESLAGKVKTLRQITLPDEYKDVTAMQEAVGDEQTCAILNGLFTKATVLYSGLDLPVHSMAELEDQYRAFVTSEHPVSFSFGKWLPSFKELRPIVPGEVVTILADTGVGKSALLQNLAFRAGPLPCLIFEIELPGTLMFERQASLTHRRSSTLIECDYRGGGGVDLTGMRHIYVCPLSKLSTRDISEIIVRSELKIGQRPAIVLVDYIGLVEPNKGLSRYEKMSEIAQDMKKIAKGCNVIMVLASQVHRKDNKAGVEVSLHDAKDTGDVENAADLLLGAWRDGTDKSKLHVKVLKNRKGTSGRQIQCLFDGGAMRIDELIAEESEI